MAKSESVFRGYVRSSEGRYLVQLPASWARSGFVLASDDQTWEGGFGAASASVTWTAIAESEVPSDVRERLGWLLEEAD